MRHPPDHPLWRDCNFTPAWFTRKQGNELGDEDAQAVSPSSALQGAR